jgi:hypothetical protein
MTYFEAVSYVRKLKQGSLSHEQIMALNNFEGETLNIKNRYTNQIIDLINYRLNASLDLFVKKLYDNLDYNGIVLEVGYIKQEIAIARSITKVNVFTEEVRTKLENDINSFASQITNAFKTGFANDIRPEVTLLINNLNFNS